jgi:hypothetical protein
MSARRHGPWVIVVGVMLTLGLHGDVWRLYHLARVFLP